MEKALGYDRKKAVDNDNGIFWIDYESMQKFFKILYINWNPALFAHTTCIHKYVLPVLPSLLFSAHLTTL
jgi:calpain-7